MANGTNELIIPPSKDEALDHYDSSYTSKPKSSSEFKFKYDETSNKKQCSYSLDTTGTYNWSSKQDDKYNNYEKSENNDSQQMIHYRELDKIDTKSLPNNLFEQKQKELEEQRKSHGYSYGNVDSSRFASVSSDPNFKETMNYTGQEEDPGMIGTFGKVVGEAFSRTKDIMTNYEIGDKLKYTGEKTLGAIKFTGSALASAAQSDTTKSIISKTGENIGYLWNRLWYGAPKEEKKDDDSDENYGNSKFIEEQDTYKSSSFSKYSPPSNDLNGSVLFKKETNRYSSKSYMN